ncbi:hypothetical protein BH24ACT15_BH24ACT15_03310 [soil metagenome]
MSGFDRIKPPEKRLLEREETAQPDSDRADPSGRAALFSVSTPPTTPGATATAPPATDPAAPTSADDPRLPSGPSALHVECGHCGVDCPLPMAQAVRNALPLTLIAPWRSHSVFATCPCGLRRAWLKPRLGLPR